MRAGRGEGKPGICLPPSGFLENKSERKKEIYEYRILTQEIQIIKKNSIE
jgi:hypothetical protein